jgi:hypothetical protein
MKFYLISGKFTTSFKNHGDISVGDTFQSVVKKYADKETLQFIGNTYAYYRVVEVRKISNNVFETVCVSNRQLVFDSKGIITTNGISKQQITIDNNNDIVHLQVIENNMEITNGTGDFEGIKGTYHPKTISPHFYEATIVFQNNNIISYILISLLSLYILYTLYNINKKA